VRQISRQVGDERDARPLHADHRDPAMITGQAGSAI
jgi:hypothetical protein